MKPENENDNYSLAYGQFVIPLVKAVQEQQQIIQQQQQQIDELKKMMENFANTLSTVASNKIALAVELSDNNTSALTQNVPNPFGAQTTITYDIPQNAGTAKIVFYNVSGQVIKTNNIITKGKGQLNVSAAGLSNGAYSYSLIIDGKIIDTKKMIKQ
jgi:flagellar hook assembly protein FlgD